ncbi:MAG: sulfite exporter TauE/SafE family protein [Chloroflexota bacterium]|nr:sulfite exporter TauE/SafE family protein [Chloroflexota bacterium]
MNWGTLDATGWMIGLAVGFFTGVVSGLMGIGGGNILVPASTILLGLGQHQAQGVSLLVIIPTAISGAWSHYKRGNVDVRVALLLSAGAVVGGLIGARIAQGIPGDQLRVIFGIILVYFAQRYLGVEAWLRARLARGGAAESN